MTPLFKKVKEGHFIKDAWITASSSWTTEIIAKAGFDTLTIDAQHGLANDLSAILPLLQAIAGTPAAPIVRIPSNDGGMAMSVLDAGVQGIICPMIKTAKETKHFLSNCLYPPNGERSFGPVRAAHLYENYFEKANESIIKMIMIETAEAIKNIEELAELDELNGFYIGPWDLSLSLGLSSIADFDDPALLRIFEKVLSHANKNNKLVGIHCSKASEAKKMRAMGFQMVTIFNDTASISKASKDSLALFNS